MATTTQTTIQQEDEYIPEFDYQKEYRAKQKAITKYVTYIKAQQPC